MNDKTNRRIEIYDTTLRDGAQGQGVSFSLVDKLQIVQHLDGLGVDYIEGGFPESNPKEKEFFTEVVKLDLRHAKLCAFGMTRRRGVTADKDPGLQALVSAQTPVITLVGKTWDLHVDEVLCVSQEENLDMIRESLAYCREQGREVFFDAEHFFDGYRANPEYALRCLRAAAEAGATRIILCDTNGGSLLLWVGRVVVEVVEALGDFGGGLGIHTHNDSGLAVANSLAAVEAGCIQVQGTINGFGERCGNVDLTTVAANLHLKMDFECLQEDSLVRLTETSRFIYSLANMNVPSSQPFVGTAAFAHKGGMHVQAVLRNPESYEHIKPEAVGNDRHILLSELSGVSNIAATIGQKFDIADDRDTQRRLLQRLEELEHQGYQFEAAPASVELLLHELLNQRPAYWQLDHYRCVILKRNDESPVTEATVKLEVAGRTEHRVAEGDGPVNALDGALRKCLKDVYPQLAHVHLFDYRVRVVNPTAESAAKVRVVSQFAVKAPVEHSDGSIVKQFATIGVNENIVDASWQAITDAFAYHLIESGVSVGQGA